MRATALLLACAAWALAPQRPQRAQRTTTTAVPRLNNPNLGQNGEVRIEATPSDGRRLAWCREYSALSGRGVLVDLEQRSEWQVDARALRVPLGTPPALHAGEFVEYEPSAARALAAGGEPSAGWVTGIAGWPLMCECEAQHVPSVG